MGGCGPRRGSPERDPRRPGPSGHHRGDPLHPPAPPTHTPSPTPPNTHNTVICLLTQCVWAGRATFLIKVKSHRGESINERADTLAEEGRTISDDDKRWDDRTDRMTFEVQKGGYDRAISVDEQCTQCLPKTGGMG